MVLIQFILYNYGAQRIWQTRLLLICCCTHWYCSYHRRKTRTVLVFWQFHRCTKSWQSQHKPKQSRWQRKAPCIFTSHTRQFAPRTHFSTALNKAERRFRFQWRNFSIVFPRYYMLSSFRSLKWQRAVSSSTYHDCQNLTYMATVTIKSHISSQISCWSRIEVNIWR